MPCQEFTEYRGTVVVVFINAQGYRVQRPSGSIHRHTRVQSTECGVPEHFGQHGKKLIRHVDLEGGKGNIYFYQYDGMMCPIAR